MRIIMRNKHDVLRNFRKSRGISCRELAKQLGISEPTLRSYENGNRRITAERAVEFEEKIGVPRHEFCPDIFGKAA